MLFERSGDKRPSSDAVVSSFERASIVPNS
jgi:hypothetical protein